VGGKKESSRWMSPLKIFEYMAERKAIVCSDLPVLREVLNDRVSSWLVPPADFAAWVAALRTLETDAPLRLSLGLAAQRYFLAHHTWQQRPEIIFEVLKPDLAPRDTLFPSESCMTPWDTRETK
jgi:glycosyltransferase involved in cell wall biosynthesis